MLALKPLRYQTAPPLIAFFTLIVALLLIFPYLYKLYFSLGQLPEEAYFEPVILVRILDQPVYPLLLFFCLTVVLLPGYRRLAWQNFEQGRVIKFFIFFLTAIIAWAFSTYDYNLYFDQSHYFDRLLLIALSLLTLQNPVFVPFFLLEAIMIGFQFEYPLRNFSWTDKAIIFKILILFHLCLYVHLLFKKYVPALFFFLALCQFGSNYFISAVGKLELDWLRFDELPGLAVNSYVNGWLAFLPETFLLPIVQAITPFNLLLLVITLVIELAALFILFHCKLTGLILSSFILLHTVIFLTSGILFWKWILVALGFILVLRIMPLETLAFLFSKPSFFASLAVIGLSPFFFNPVKLAWLDTNLNNSYDLEVVGLSGRVYPVSRVFMSPYDLSFAQNRFYFLSDENLLVRTYGAVVDREVAAALKTIQPGLNLQDLEQTKGKNYHSTESSQRFEDFLKTYFYHLNQRGSKTVFLHYLGAPHHIWSFADANAYQLQEPVRQIRIKFIKTFYDGQKIHRLRDEVIKVIDIPFGGEF